MGHVDEYMGIERKNLHFRIISTGYLTLKECKSVTLK